MVEALVAFGMGGGLGGGQEAHELRRQEGGVLHLVLGLAGVDVDAVDPDLGGRGVEVLILQLPDLAAVHGVGLLRGELGEVEVVRAPANLLVRREADGDLAVLLLRMGQEAGAGADDLGDACLVVRPQEGGAVGDDELLADVLREVREVLHPQGLAVPQLDVPALVAEAPGLHVLAADAGGGVHVGDEAQGGQVLAAGGGRQHAVDIAGPVQLHVLKAQGRQLLREGLAQDPLPGRGGHGLRVLIRGGVVGDILQKAFLDVHDILLAPPRAGMVFGAILTHSAPQGKAEPYPGGRVFRAPAVYF